jgi:hypothetical protein
MRKAQIQALGATASAGGGRQDFLIPTGNQLQSSQIGLRGESWKRAELNDASRQKLRSTGGDLKSTF